MIRPIAFLIAGIALLISGCTPPAGDGAFGEVRHLVEERTPQAIRWNQRSAEDVAVADELREILKRPLNAQDAVQVALLNNRSLQATYEDLGIAQADLVQAGLMSNPRFFASLRFPDRGPRSPDSEFSVAADFLDLFLIPLRKQIAADRLAVAERRIADAVLKLQRDVRVALYIYQGRQQTLALQKTLLDSQLASVELARHQHEAGNISDLDLASEEANYSAARLDVARTEIQARADREELNQLMGLWGQGSAGWQAAAMLPDVPADEPAMEHLETVAIRQRLDLDAERRETLALARSMGLAEQFRLSGLEIGIDTERDPTSGGVHVTGPQLTVELPIFDQKQAQISRLQAEYRQRLDRLTALAINIRSQVRSARDRVLGTRETARFYHDVLIPQRQQVSKMSRLHYNAMVLGVDRWLMAHQAEVNAYREYIDVVRDYWIAKADLERVAGGRITEKPAEMQMH